MKWLTEGSGGSLAVDAVADGTRIRFTFPRDGRV
jgi:hypothetical protein